MQGMRQVLFGGMPAMPNVKKPQRQPLSQKIFRPGHDDDWQSLAHLLESLYTP
jgi:hypothetical protein